MRWMRRWLLGEDDAPIEGDFPIATDAEMQCTRSGQVLTEFHGKSAFDLIAARADELATARSLRRAERGSARLLEDVRRLIAWDTVAATEASVREVAAPPGPGRRVRKLVVEMEPGIKVPATLVTPERVVGGSPLIFVIGYDRSTVFRPDGHVDRWTDQGHRVLLADPRGMGETAPTPRNTKAPGPLGVDEREAFLSFDLNRPLLGQRVYDLLRVLDSVGDEIRSGVHLIGIGTGGPIALHAAALDPRITQVTLERSVLSWSEVARMPISRDQLCNVVPRALESYDLPELAASLAPRPLTILAPLDPAQRPAARATSDQALDIVRQAYRSLDAEDRLAIRAEP